MTASAALALALLLALEAPRPAAAQCTGSTYSFGGLPCAPCASGAVFISSASGCAPSAALTAGPADTAFYLSGTAVEGTAAFQNISAPTGITYVIDPFGVSNGAASFATGSYLSASGARAPPALPADGSVAVSASAWVRCSTPPASYSSVLGWGAPGDVSAVSSNTISATSVSLVVSGGGLLPSSGTVASFVGGGATGGVSGTADGTGTNAQLFGPRAMAVIPSDGNIIVTDQSSHCLRMVTPAGVVTKFAGLCGTLGTADGTGTNARFNTLSGVAFHPATGGLVIADNNNHIIRLITYPGAVVTTFAGTVGVTGLVDAVGTNARFNTPPGLAVIPSTGDIVVAGRNNNCIRRVTFPGAVVSTLVGSPTGVGGFADGVGLAALMQGPYGIAVSANSDLIATTDSSGRIRLITFPGLVVTTVGGSTVLAADGVGSNANFADPRAVAITAQGIVIAGDSGNHKLRTINPATLAVSTLVGPPAGTNPAFWANGVGTSAGFNYPAGLLILPGGLILVAENGDQAVRVVTLPFVLPACDSTWHHVALTFSPSATPFSLVGFLDGAAVLQQAANITLPARASSSLRVAWNGDLSTNAGSLFSGAVDELRIFARALTAAEVTALSQPRLASFLAQFPNTASSPAFATASATSYTLSCVSGYAGPPASLTRRSSDGSWAWLGGVTPSCTICGAGTYSAAGATACTLCPTGITTTGMSTGGVSVASCTTCAPGFYGAVTGVSVEERAAPLAPAARLSARNVVDFFY